MPDKYPQNISLSALPYPLSLFFQRPKPLKKHDKHPLEIRV